MGLVVRIGADITAYDKAMKKLTSETETISKKLNGMGNSLTAGVTLPITLAGGAITKVAAEFESSFAGVKKTVDATDEELQQFSDGIRIMAKTIPATTTEINGVAEAAGQLGIKKDKILGFTRTMIDMGVATNLSSQDAAVALARMANITNMSQDKFSNLGSAIVALGNNLATTEAEIVEMTLRLAAQGTQVGMTEDKILAVAGAMSSMGINAEAGGTAMTKIMKKIDSAVREGGKAVTDFSDVAGMSAKDFQKAWKDDAAGALLTLIEGMEKLGKAGGDVNSALADMGIKDVYESDAMLRLAGNSKVLADALGISAKGWKENTALTNEATQRYETFNSKMTIMKNKISDIAIEVGPAMLDAMGDIMDAAEPLIQGVGNLAKQFSSLSSEQQTNILKWVGIAAAIGPAMKAVGGIVSIGGKAAGAFRILTGAAGGLAPVVGGLGPAVGGLGAGLGGVLAVAAPVALGVAAVGTAGYLVYQGLTKEAVPAVDLFAGQVEKAGGTTKMMETKVSEATQQVINDFMTLSNSTSQELINMQATQDTMTTEHTNSLKSKYSEMSAAIVAGYQKQTTDSIETVKAGFEGMKTVTAEEQAAIIKQLEEHNASEIKSAQEKEKRAIEIIETAAKEKRALTEKERTELLSIQDNYQSQAVKSLASNKAEQEVILNNLKTYKERVNAEQLADAVKKINEQRDKTVEVAKQERDERIRAAEEIRTQLGAAGEETAQKMIDEANRQYEDVVDAADKTRTEGINKLESSYTDLREKVNVETGTILTAWDKVKNWWNSWWPSKKTMEVETKGADVGKNANGTKNFSGGATWINERGPELVTLPKGTQIIPNALSEKMMSSYGRQMAKMDSQTQGAAGGNLTLHIENFVNEREQDVSNLMQEMSFYARRNKLAIGGEW